MKIFAFIFSVLFVACKCQNIECETGPPDLNIQLVDSTGLDPISTGSLSLENVVLLNIKKQTISIPLYYMGVISFNVDNMSSDYVLAVDNVIIDTLKVTTFLSEGECCSSFRVGNVSIKNQTVEFRPFLKLSLP
jgi:hypothetical protein